MSEALRNVLLSTDLDSSDPSLDQVSVPTDDEIRLATENDPVNGLLLQSTEPIPPAIVENTVPSEAEEPKSTLGAVSAGMAQAVDVALPTTAALVAFPVGVAGAGLATSPTGPVALGAGFVGGVAAAAGAYWATDQAQNLAFEYVSPESYKEWQGYLKKSQEQYPVSSGVGQIAPNAVAFRPSFSNVKDAVSFSRQLLSKSSAKELTTAIGKTRIENLANVVFGAGTELAAETIRQATEEGNFDFARLAAMTVAGAMMNKPTALGKKLTKIAGFNADEVPLEPVATDADGELAEALMRQLEGGETSATGEKAKQTGVSTEPKAGDQSGEAPKASPSDSVSGQAGGEVTPTVLPPMSEAAKQQAEQATEQLKEFASLINQDISGDISQRAAEAGNLNLDLLNAAITREPERALQALAITLKDELKVPSLTAENRARDAEQWLTSHGYEERIEALRSNAKTTDELNYQIIAARYMTEQAVNALRKAEEKVRVTNSEESLAEAVSLFLEVKRVLKPAERIRGNWGRMGHAFRNMDPKFRNISTINKLMEKAGIDDFQNLTKDKAEQLMGMISLALKSDNPKAFSKIANMSEMDIAVGSLSEALTGSVMSVVDTSIINVVGGIGETIMAPVSGTLSGAYGFVTNSIKRMAGKATDEDVRRELATMEASFNYFRYATKRFDSNLKAFFSIVGNSEIKFGEAASKLEEIRGGMPVERGQRISEPKSWGQKAASAVYGKLGKYRTRGWITSETYGIDPNKNPMGALFVDSIGEVFRAVHRTILGADDFIKASNAYAAAHTKLLIEGREQGLKGDKLNSFINERIDILIDSNNRLYSRNRIMDDVRKEVESEGITGADAYAEVIKRTEERFNTEMGELAKFADEWARQITYQSDLGNRLNGKPTMGKSFQTIMQNHPLMRLSLGFLFIQTPVNLFKMTGRYIPNAALLEKVASIRFRGGRQPFNSLRNIQKEYTEAYTSGDPFRIAQARGRQLAGSTITAGALWMASNDLMTDGGPRNKESRKLWLSKGNIPYAFKIKKGSNAAKEIEEELAKNPNAVKPNSETATHYLFEFKRLHEPTAAFFMAASDTVAYMKRPEYDERDAADLAGILSLVVGTQLTEKVFLNNIKQWSDLFKGVSEDQRDIGRKLLTYLGRRTAPLTTPVMESTDPVIYDLSSFTQHIARRMPEGLRETVFGEDMYLPRAYNLLGENIDAAITQIPLIDHFNPFYLSSTKNDPVIDELLSLNHNFSSPEKYYGTEDGQGWDIRGFVYKGGAFSKLASDSNEIRDFSANKFLDLLKAKDINEDEASLGLLYQNLGVKTMPKLGQDAYDRWQENIGQIKIQGMSLRDALSMVIKSGEYQSLENQILQGEDNPRAKLLMSVVSSYRTAALELTKEEYPEFKRAFTVKKITNDALKGGIKREGLKGIRKQVEDALNFPN
jgi:hypothetical protein